MEKPNKKNQWKNKSDEKKKDLERKELRNNKIKWCTT